ncbi:exportin 1A [Tanacetum coccineum]
MLSSFCLCGGKNESQLIQELCLYVLPGYQHLKRTDLICSTLAASHAFLSWIPLCYIFESTLMQTFLKIFPVPSYRNLILQCWTEVAALNLRDSYNGQYVYMYNIFIVQATELDYGKQKLNETITKLSGGAAVIWMYFSFPGFNFSSLSKYSFVSSLKCASGWAETKTKLKEKKLKVEDGLNSTKAVVEEGIVVGGGYTLLRLAAKVNKLSVKLMCSYKRHVRYFILIMVDRGPQVFEQCPKAESIFLEHTLKHEHAL